MLRINQIKVHIEHTMDELRKKISQELKTDVNNIIDFKILKKSIDARKKPQLFYIYNICVNVIDEDSILRKNRNNNIVLYNELKYKFRNRYTLRQRPIVVGSGPAGLFCAYQLALANCKPIVLERGKEVLERIADVNNFWNNNELNTNSNVLFGEGGAGTFSDGKLNTLVNDKSGRNNYVLETFVEFGAPENILYDSKPHIGTDILIDVVANMRNRIIELGGEFRFNSCVSDIIVEDDCVTGVVVNDNDIYSSSVVVLAIGHSARDTFNMIYSKNISMESKNFAVGFRVEHLQDVINTSQYGINYTDALPAANYKLTYNTCDKRGVYSFCMCPGGYVVNSSSEPNRLSINGMSYSKRDSKNANSAIIMTVNSDDYGTSSPLVGMYFQEKIEENAYKAGNGDVPVQRYIDFKLGKQTSLNDIKYQPLIKGKYTGANLTTILTKELNDAFVEGMEYFGKIINGFNDDEVIISGIESRTSSPIRIIRDDNLESNFKGLFPCGEGAGYAGGIMSAAMDGLRVSEKIALNYGRDIV